MKVLAIIQARMNSERLPQKVVKEINQKPMILHIIDRINRSKYIEKIIVATTTQKEDQVIKSVINDTRIEVYSGSIYNVLERFYLCAKAYQPEYIVRLTGDNPLIDVDLVDKAIEEITSVVGENRIDYLAFKEGFPLGLGVEVFTFNALKMSYEKATLSYEQEHVTPYMYCHPDEFNIKFVKNKNDYSGLRLTCDTKEDFELISAVYKHFANRDYFGMNDIVNYISENPDLKKINTGIVQKSFMQSQI